MDGFFLDTMSAFRRCFCEKCRALYREYSGKEIPVELDDPELPAYGLYKKKLTAETIERIRSELLAVNPKLKIIFNHEGGPLVPWEMSIAAASVLAKTYRDDFMNKIALEYPQYDWLENKGYPTKKHRDAIKQFGTTPYHRMSFNLLGDGQLSFDF